MPNDNSQKVSSETHAHAVGVGHEGSALGIGPVVWFLIGLTVVTVVICLLMVGLLDAFENREKESERRTSPLAAERQKLPPEPRLQLAPSSAEQLEAKRPPNLKADHPLQEMKRLREEENNKLSSYGWVDENAGIVRIPIEEAKRLLLEKGVPTRK
jgi:hypothetical protein